jgi:hypothetical protein
LLAAEGCLCQAFDLLVPLQPVFHVEDLKRVRRLVRVQLQSAWGSQKPS